MKDYIPKLVQINMVTIFVFFAFCIGACAGGNNSLPESSNDDDVSSGIVNPFNSSCYGGVTNHAGHIFPVRKPLE